MRFIIVREYLSEMKQILVFLSIVLCATGATRSNRIYAGQDAAPGQFPFMVALNDVYQNCNGVIIAPSWILTTAFCVFYKSPTAEVYVGSTMSQANGTAYRLFERVTHEEYDSWTWQNDLALVRINSVLEYSDNVQEIEFGDVPAPNSTCTMLGWGSSDVQDDPPLQYLETTIIDLELCKNFSAETSDWRYLGPEKICTLNAVGAGTCFDDYGGALVCDGKLSGVLSYPLGLECGGGMPDVFTSITSYEEWIRSYIGR